MSKEAIVDKILGDAQIRANSFVEEQSEKAREILADSADQCRAYYYSHKGETDRAVNDILERGRINSALEARKMTLAAKTKVLDEVFLRAAQKLKALSGDTLRDLLLGMLEQAEDGDVVVLGKGQRDAISREDIAALANRKGISLTLSDEIGGFDGIVLKGNGVDKNLTFDVETDALREELQTKIAKEIFG